MAAFNSRCGHHSSTMNMAFDVHAGVFSYLASTFLLTHVSVSVGTTLLLSQCHTPLKGGDCLFFRIACWQGAAVPLPWECVTLRCPRQFQFLACFFLCVSVNGWLECAVPVSDWLVASLFHYNMRQGCTLHPGQLVMEPRGLVVFLPQPCALFAPQAETLRIMALGEKMYQVVVCLHWMR